jgi:hypothetical protein
MAFDNSFTAVTGATYTAAQYNTYTKGNLAAIWVGALGGDLDYYTSSETKSRLANVTGGILTGGASAPGYLAKGGSHTFVKAGTSAPEYGALVHRRQGGSATVWTSPGTTSYTPTNTLIQTGIKAITISSGFGNVAVTYPVAFSQRPLIFLSLEAASLAFSWGLGFSDDTLTGFGANAKFSGAYDGTLNIGWLAIGG